MDRVDNVWVANGDGTFTDAEGVVWTPLKASSAEPEAPKSDSVFVSPKSVNDRTCVHHTDEERAAAWEFSNACGCPVCAKAQAPPDIEHSPSLVPQMKKDSGEKDASRRNALNLQMAMKAIRSRLATKPAWYKRENSVAPKYPEWWVTDFTKDQMDGNIANCIRIIDAALQDAREVTDAVGHCPPAQPSKSSSAAQEVPASEQNSTLLQAARTLRTWARARQIISGKWTTQEQSAIDCAIKLEFIAQEVPAGVEQEKDLET